jgi:hypothetical protein
MPNSLARVEPYSQTADRVLVRVDIERAPEQLVNRRLAYVAISRGRFDAQIFTGDKARLLEALGRDISQRAAMVVGQAQNPEEAPVLAAVAAASVDGRVALEPRAGTRVRRCGDPPEEVAPPTLGP